MTERSFVTTRSMRGSISLRSAGSMAFTLSTTSMMFAPGCWKICTPTAGWPLNRPNVRMFSVAPSCMSDTVATSDSRTVAPLRFAITSCRY